MGIPRLIASHAASATAMAIPWPALLVVLWDHTHDDALLSLAGIARVLPYVVLSWLAGGLGDRLGRLRVVRASTHLRVALLAAVPILLAIGEPVLALIPATAAVAVGIPAFPALAAWLPSNAADPDRATGWLVTVEVSAFAVGAAVGGLILGVAGPIPSVLLAAGLALVGAGLLTGLRLTVEPHLALGGDSILRGLRVLLGVPAVVSATAVMMTVNFVLGAFGVGLLLVGEERWATGPAEFGWLTAALGFSSLLAPALAAFHLRRTSTPAGSILLMVAPLGALAVIDSWQLAVLPLVVLGAGATLIECGTTRMLQQAAPSQHGAAALGVADTAMMTAAMVGAGVAPLVSRAIGPVGLLIALALVAVGALAFGFKLGRGILAPCPAPTSPALSSPASLTAK